MVPERKEPFFAEMLLLQSEKGCTFALANKKNSQHDEQKVITGPGL